MKIIFKEIAGRKCVDKISWEQEDDDYIREKWDDRGCSVTQIAEHFGIYKQQVSKRAQALGLGRKSGTRPNLDKYDDELIEAIRQRYPKTLKPNELAEELGIDEKTLRNIVKGLGVKRDKNTYYQTYGSKYGKRDERIAQANELLQSLDIDFNINDSEGNFIKWILPKGFVRTLINKEPSYNNYDVYDIQDKHGDYLATIKVLPKPNEKDLRTAKRSTYLKLLKEIEDKYIMSVETRALCMIVDLPFMEYNIIDSEGKVFLTRKPSDYFNTELELLEHKAMLAAWRVAHEDMASKGFSIFKEISPRIKELKGIRQRMMEDMTNNPNIK